jgi:MFS family permease
MIWRTAALIIFLVVNCPTDNIDKQKGISYGSILNQQTFILYVIPWLMFSLVNFLSVPIQMDMLDKTTIETYMMIEAALAGIFAVVAGFLSDIIGRKRVTISGFVLLGIGYAILGISQGILGIPGDNPLIWFLYTVVDGIAWGIFSVIFIMTIWGDLSYGGSCEKYYALGGIPFFISNFLRILVGPLIASGTDSQTMGAAIFSLTAFFLFMAVLPLMFAPETLPEKRIKERELRKYISAAQKAKKKYA